MKTGGTVERLQQAERALHDAAFALVKHTGCTHECSEDSRLQFVHYFTKAMTLLDEVLIYSERLTRAERIAIIIKKGQLNEV